MAESQVLGAALQKTIEAYSIPPPPADNGGGDDNKLRVFMAAEHVHGQGGRFYEMDLTKTLADNLKGAVVVEHPTFHVDDARASADRYPRVDGSNPTSSSSAIGNGKPAKKSQAVSNIGDVPMKKKAKLTFYEVSDGELMTSDDEDTNNNV